MFLDLVDMEGKEMPHKTKNLMNPPGFTALVAPDFLHVCVQLPVHAEGGKEASMDGKMESMLCELFTIQFLSIVRLYTAFKYRDVTIITAKTSPYLHANSTKIFP